MPEVTVAGSDTQMTATRAEIAQVCREKLASYKQPRSVTGKLLRHELATRPSSDDHRI